MVHDLKELRNEKMRKTDALKLQLGDKVIWRDSRHEVMTVVEVVFEPTLKEPRGNFPLIITDKSDGVELVSLSLRTFTYLGLERVGE